MRSLILPDIHDKIRQANRIIEREPHDRLVLMGDFFDGFRTGVTDAADTAKQVKSWLHDSNTTCLLGNHDISCGWAARGQKQNAINPEGLGVTPYQILFSPSAVWLSFSISRPICPPREAPGGHDRLVGVIRRREYTKSLAQQSVVWWPFGTRSGQL